MDGQISRTQSENGHEIIPDDAIISNNDNDDVEDASQSVSQRKRGVGRDWSHVKTHVNLQTGFKSMRELNIPTVTRLKGRNNRGKTASYNYYCVKKSCGCTKEWRLVTALDSLFVTEEETRADHICHEMYMRNGGRGLSFEQVQIVDESFLLGIRKPKFMIDFFKEKAILNPNAGLSLIFRISNALSNCLS